MSATASAPMNADRGHAPGVRRVSWITLLLNLLVSGGKIAVGLLSGSVSMVADGYHSLVDGSNNVIGLIVAAFAYAPPGPRPPLRPSEVRDRGHPLHRRAPSWPSPTAWWPRPSAARPRAAPRDRLPQLGGHDRHHGHEPVRLALRGARGPPPGQRVPASPTPPTRARTSTSPSGVIASFAGAKAGLVWSDTAVAIGIARRDRGPGRAHPGGRLPRAHRPRGAHPRSASPPRRAAVPGCAPCARSARGAAPDAVYVDLIAHVDGHLSLRAAHDVADRIEAALQAAHPQIVDVVVHLEPAGLERLALLPAALGAGAEAAQQAEAVDPRVVVVGPGRGQGVVARRPRCGSAPGRSGRDSSRPGAWPWQPAQGHQLRR